MSSITQEKLDLIHQLGKEQAVASSVSASDGPYILVGVYSRNDTLWKLTELHRQYDPNRGRVFPLFNEDFEEEREEGLPELNLEEDEALGTVLYHWAMIQGMTTSLINFAFHLTLMDGAITELLSYVDNRDGERPF
jgi:hypothetical protein